MPLGVFDSGAGGLTVYKALCDGLEEADLIYLGDTARVPYGGKSRDTIIKYASECAGFLVNRHKADVLVVACNTISCYALEYLKDKFGIPVYGVIDSGASRAMELTSNGHLGLIGTTATINSGAYVDALRQISSSFRLEQKACPLFVPLVEEGMISGDIAEAVIHHYLDDIMASGIDTLILGCTHYPFLAPEISRLYPGVNLAEGSEGLLRQMKTAGRGIGGEGTRRVFVTERSKFFDELKTILVGGIPVEPAVI